MLKITKKEDFDLLDDGNQVLGEQPNLIDSQIIFEGCNNILYCEESVSLKKAKINFRGDNSIIYLSKSNKNFYIGLTISTDCVIYFGIHSATSATNKRLKLVCYEHKYVLIGDYVQISHDVCIRNSDAHPIYDVATGLRNNYSKSIFIGDHVWIGHNSILLKGTKIDSGSIIAAGSVVSGKHIPHNSIWGGNPVSKLKDDIFWDATSLKNWTEEETNTRRSFSDLKKIKDVDKWKYEYSPSEAVCFYDIDAALDSCKTSQERLDYLFLLKSKKTKNRFVHS